VGLARCMDGWMDDLFDGLRAGDGMIHYDRGNSIPRGPALFRESRFYSERSGYIRREADDSARRKEENPPFVAPPLAGGSCAADSAIPAGRDVARAVARRRM
jgi:hypothetical protein